MFAIMGKMFSKDGGHVLEVEDYHEFVQKRSKWCRPVSVVYNPFTNATPIWLWSYKNRPSLLTTDDVKSITILSSQPRSLPATEHDSSEVWSSDVYDSPHETSDESTGVWIFSVRDCCDSVDFIWRRLVFTFLDGTLAHYGKQLQISPTNQQKDGWHVFRVYTNSAHDTVHMLASEEAVRQRGVRSTMFFFSCMDQDHPSYISYYDEHDSSVCVVVHKTDNDGCKLKEYQTRPLPRRQRCSNCTTPVSHTTIEQL